MANLDLKPRTLHFGNPTMPYPSAGLAQAEADFRRRYPEYEHTAKLDELRATDYARLDTQAHVYLDYAGGGLYAESQLRDHMALLNEQVYGNPHSKNLTSMAMTNLVERAREYVLRYFNADPDEYLAIFTQNATGALKLIGESYPFAPGGNFLLTFDNHNSVNGIREFARSGGAAVTYIPIVAPELRAGCHCNPGAREMALGFTREDLASCFSEKDQMSFEQFLQVIDGKTTGALRASLGLASTFADVYAYVQFAETFVDRPAEEAVQ